MKINPFAFTFLLASTLVVPGIVQAESTPNASLMDRWQLRLIPCINGSEPALDGFSIAYTIPGELKILGMPVRPVVSMELMGRHHSKMDEYGSDRYRYESTYSVLFELHKSWSAIDQRVAGSIYGGIGFGSVYYFVEIDQEEEDSFKGTSPVIQVGVQAYGEFPRFPDLGGGLVYMTTPHFGSSVLFTIGERGNLLELGLSAAAVIAIAIAFSLLSD